MATIIFPTDRHHGTVTSTAGSSNGSIDRCFDDTTQASKP
jgi:hypothetical protein